VEFHGTRLSDKIAVVTGAGAGIGRAIAIAFGREGACVVATGRRELPLAEVVETIRTHGKHASLVVADVTRVADIDRLVETVIKRHGRIDVLVNNAGVMVSRTTVADCPDDDWTGTLEANMTSVFRCSRRALPALIAARGAIVNIASIAGAKGSPSLASYAAAKAGVINLTKTMALECAANGVRVNAICPGYVETDMNRTYLEELRKAGRYEALIGKHPLGLGRPEDVAWAAVYLASDEAQWVTGVALPVDGGLLAGT
jgi:3-oxoacyl-[acyl-carrier protein] reductase